MKKISKHLISLAIISLLVLPLLTLTARAQTGADTFGLSNVNEGLGGSLSQSDPRTIAGRIINVALGFLGVIALGLVLMGGFKWMTAAGNEEKTAEARKLLGAGVVGLVIIFASWGIANFVINAINSSVQNNG